MKYLPLILITLLLVNCTSNNRMNELEQKVGRLTAIKDSLQRVVDSLTISKPDSDLTFWKFSKKGIENPRLFIEKELLNRTELIPLEPVLGGTMRFTKIVVLGDNWVVATYEDGHIMGKSLYRYVLRDDTTLKFTRLYSVHP